MARGGMYRLSFYVQFRVLVMTKVSFILFYSHLESFRLNCFKN